MDGPAQPKRIRIARKLMIDLSIMTVIGVVLALIGPFGTIALPLPMRLVSWVGLSYVGYAAYSPMGYFVERLHESLALPRLGLWIACVLVATVPLAVVIWIIGFLPGSARMPTPEEALSAYLNVLVIGASITVLFHLIERSNAASPQHPGVSGDDQPVARPAAGETKPETWPRFLDRLPPELGTDLLALEMEDHYVRAHTALGSDLVLLRMRDAVAELDGIEGARVHRSWWVARIAVEDVRREGRNVRLVLPDGLEAPVSRANVPMLKERGWI